MKKIKKIFQIPLKKIKKILQILCKPQNKVLTYYRLSKWLYQKKHYFLAELVRHKQANYGCYISEKAIIHPSVVLKHSVGVVIGEGVVIEEDVFIWQNVTIGSHGKKGIPLEYPHIKSGVKIFAGAVIVGNVVVGKNAVIGANCVVLDDVPENGVAVGVPYKNKKSVSS